MFVGLESLLQANYMCFFFLFRFEQERWWQTRSKTQYECVCVFCTVVFRKQIGISSYFVQHSIALRVRVYIDVCMFLFVLLFFFSFESSDLALTFWLIIFHLYWCCYACCNFVFVCWCYCCNWGGLFLAWLHITVYLLQWLRCHMFAFALVLEHNFHLISVVTDDRFLTNITYTFDFEMDTGRPVLVRYQCTHYSVFHLPFECFYHFILTVCFFHFVRNSEAFNFSVTNTSCCHSYMKYFQVERLSTNFWR